jgi:GDSL-like Lipase/Acylhydrolase
MSRILKLELFATVVLLLTLSHPGAGQGAPPLFLGMGDSIGEAVQSADASEATQPFSYLNLMAWQIGAAFPLPLIHTGLFAVVGNTTDRSRIDPTVRGLNLAVSGADVNSILLDRADAFDESHIDTETDLVLFPRLGSQMEIAEGLRPQNVVCWIGSNDALGAALSFDQLDASQLTPIQEFSARFEEIVRRLLAIGSRVVFGTIPDVGQIAYLVDRQDLIRFLGSDFGLPADSRTTLSAMLLVRLGLVDPSVLTNPAFVLDAAERQIISDRIAAFNDIIRFNAAAHGMAVADINAAYQFFVDTPVTVAGVPITTRFLGGLFSLDGVHPSNLAHAIIANLFVEQFNQHYGLSIPRLHDSVVWWLFLTDPFIDKDGDGRVTGRFGAGLLETLAPFVGFSGDADDFAFSAAGVGQTQASAETFLREYTRQTGRDLRKRSLRGRIEAFKQLFGLGRIRLR